MPPRRAVRGLLESPEAGNENAGAGRLNVGRKNGARTPLGVVQAENRSTGAPSRAGAKSKDVPPRAVTLVLLELRDQYREADEAASGKNLRFSQTHRANNEVYLPHQGFEAMKNRPTRCTFFERGGTLRQRVPESFEGLGGSFQLTARIEDLAELGIEAFRDPDAAFDKAKRTAAENLAQKLEKDHKMEKGEALRSAELVMDPLELVHFHGFDVRVTSKTPKGRMWWQCLISPLLVLRFDGDLWLNDASGNQSRITAQDIGGLWEAKRYPYSTSARLLGGATAAAAGAAPTADGESDGEEEEEAHAGESDGDDADSQRMLPPQPRARTPRSESARSTPPNGAKATPPASAARGFGATPQNTGSGSRKRPAAAAEAAPTRTPAARAAPAACPNTAPAPGRRAPTRSASANARAVTAAAAAPLGRTRSGKRQAVLQHGSSSPDFGTFGAAAAAAAAELGSTAFDGDDADAGAWGCGGTPRGPDARTSAFARSQSEPRFPSASFSFPSVQPPAAAMGLFSPHPAANAAAAGGFPLFQPLPLPAAAALADPAPRPSDAGGVRRRLSLEPSAAAADGEDEEVLRLADFAGQAVRDEMLPPLSEEPDLSRHRGGDGGRGRRGSSLSWGPFPVPAGLRRSRERGAASAAEAAAPPLPPIWAHHEHDHGYIGGASSAAALSAMALSIEPGRMSTESALSAPEHGLMAASLGLLSASVELASADQAAADMVE